MRTILLALLFLPTPALAFDEADYNRDGEVTRSEQERFDAPAKIAREIQWERLERDEDRRRQREREAREDRERERREHQDWVEKRWRERYGD